MVTWRELLSETEQRLRKLGTPHEATWIISEASGAEGSELLLILEDPVSEGGMARLDRMLSRREAGEPLQYVLGHWGFRELDLMVDDRVLIPRPETETVTGIALDELDRLGGRHTETTVIDLGTGSGAIALSIAAERVRTRVWATDTSADALVVARANAAGLGRAASRVTLSEGSWFSALPDSLRGEVDLVVSNPPYVALGAALPAEVSDHEPEQALYSGSDGLDDVRTIIECAAEWLNESGVLVCELSPEQAPAAQAFAEPLFGEVVVAPDLNGRPRALVARRPVSIP